MPKNVTISISDELAEKMAKMPEINWSEVGRQTITKFIEEREPKEKGDLITDLEEYMKAKSANSEAEEAIRNVEIKRFTRKWGEPEIISFHTQTPYIRLKKTQDIKIEDTNIVSLKIFNDVLLRTTHINSSDSLWREFDAEKWKLIAKENLGHIVEYFKSKDYIVGEYEGLSPVQLAEYVTDSDRKAGDAISRKGATGLFALDNEDLVFIAYRIWSKNKDCSIGDKKEIG